MLVSRRQQFAHRGECTVASRISDADDVAVAVVVDYGTDGGMLPVLSSTCKAWGVDFAKDVRFHAVQNLRAGIQRTRGGKAKTADWKPHMSGCLTSPWTDNSDGVRLALCPELFVPAIPPMQGAPPRPAAAGAAPVVCIFGTNNCVLASDACNPIALCFASDIALNDMSKTADFVSAVPYRLVRPKKGGKSSAQPWAWRRYYPNLSAAEFSVPTAQVELIKFWMRQSGGKKQIPVFGDTETAKEGFKKDVVALLNVAKSDSAAQKKIAQKSKTKKAASDCEDETQDWLLDGKGPGLKENRVSEAQKRRAAAAKGAASVDFSTLNGGFLASDGAGGDGTSLLEAVFEEAGELVELSPTFSGAKQGLLSKRAQAEQGITRTT